jgi:hypothetical protein
LLHGHDDNVIPAVESALLAAHLSGSTSVHHLVSGFLSHADVAHRPTPGQIWRMIDFWTRAMGEQQPPWRWVPAWLVS